MQRGEIWWAKLPKPVASEPGNRRPVLIIQSDEFNRSRIRTVIAAVLTTNLRLTEAPDNILVTTDETDLPQDSVVNVSQVITVDKSFLIEQVGQVGDACGRRSRSVSQRSHRAMLLVDEGLRLVLVANYKLTTPATNSKIILL